MLRFEILRFENVEVREALRWAEKKLRTAENFQEMEGSWGAGH